MVVPSRSWARAAGIGAASAVACAAVGAEPFLLGRDEARLAAVAREIADAGGAADVADRLRALGVEPGDRAVAYCRTAPKGWSRSWRPRCRRRMGADGPRLRGARGRGPDVAVVTPRADLRLRR